MARPSKRGTRTAFVAIALTAMTFSFGVVTAGSAAASGTYTGRAYIYGTGYLDGDWADEGVNNVSTHRYSNATCLWQTILRADGFLAESDVDGIFGDRTHAATVRWQRDHGLYGDGSVGRDTWARAGRKVTDTGPDGDYRYGGYAGTHYSFAVLRHRDGGKYGFYEPGGGLRWASYDTRTCS